jgi:uncharacterized repeat protein (TIGR03843 family)
MSSPDDLFAPQPPDMRGDDGDGPRAAPLPVFDAACIPMETLGRPIDVLLGIMETGALDEQYGMLRWSSNYAFLLSIREPAADSGEPAAATAVKRPFAPDADRPFGMNEFITPGTLTAVYKPRRGERPLWDFPDGTLYQRERASFLLSHALGWQIVPPTVIREGPHGVGSFQLFIEHDPNLHYFHLEESAWSMDVLRPQLMRIAAFDVLVNNADRKGGHCLLDAHGHLWGIDQGLTFNAQHKLRTVIWEFEGQPIPAPILHDIERVCEEADDEAAPLGLALAGLLAPGEVSAFRNRARLLIRRGRYPRPGNGPSYPWPAV